MQEDDSTDYEEVYERLRVYKEEVLQGEEAEVNAIQSPLSFTSSITEKEFCEMVEIAKRIYKSRRHIPSRTITAFTK